MRTAPAETPVAEPLDSLELRWIFPGPLGTPMREWFARFPAETETREDTYLLQPRLAGLSVKLRDGVALEVKSYLGSPGVLDLPRRCRGRLEYWRKSSFRFDAPDIRDVPAGWSIVRKRRLRSWFPTAAGDHPPGSSADRTGCAVELAQVEPRGEPWWSLGFEATGPAGLLRDALEHAAVLVFAQPLSAGVEFGLDKSRSYADWLTELSAQGTHDESRGPLDTVPCQEPFRSRDEMRRR